MAIFKDLTDCVFGRLTVVKCARKVQSGKRERYYWLCKCACGNTKEVRTDCLTSGNVRSCGCLHKEQAITNVSKHHKHKMSGTRLYHEWQGMKRRCLNSKEKSYERYGGRGITICEEWLMPDNFINWALRNGYNDTLTIDRIDNNKGYRPDNCRWTDIKTQCRNRRSNIIIEHQGRKITLIELSEITGLTYSCLSSRYARGLRGNELARPIT